MKRIYRLMMTAVFAVSLFSHGSVQAASGIPAFPGAEGFGANTVGGRGGAVYEVTNTGDSGPGSLRNCVEASGPRTCVFKTGGLISLSKPLTVTHPYLTIAGQTAPGGGITVRLGSADDGFLIETGEVIMRYISLRPGPGGENHGAQIAANGATLNDVMVDHLSISWGVDSDIETWYRVTNATVQWSIISEALDCSTHSKGCHSMGLMIGGYQKGESDSSRGTENVSIHHNLMAHDGERTPLMQLCGIGQVINNTTYNPFWTFSHQQDNCTDKTANNTVNWIGNYHKAGPDSTSSTDLKVLPADSGAYSHVAHVYVQGNLGPSRTSNSQPDSNWVDSGSQQFIVTTPAAAPAVTTTDAVTAYNDVLNGAGNSQGLDCNGNWFSRRDAIDSRVVGDVKNGTGHIIDDPSQVGGWITPAAGATCADADHDGMPDSWEAAQGLNPNNPSDANGDADGDGYTNLEEYLDGGASGGGGTPTTPFADVPVPGKEWMEPWIDAFYYVGITGGCGQNPLIYCPENNVTRAEMAVFLLRSRHGAAYAPPKASHFFRDMPVVGKEWMEAWVDQYYREGMTSGCNTSPLRFCPEKNATRAEMAVFVLRATHGAGYVPPAATGIFSDVPVAGKEWMQPWVEEYYREGISAGCGSGRFCPETLTTRAEMAVFIDHAFGIPPSP